jgi:hypothetical protein
MSNSIIELGQHSERGKSEIQNLRTTTQGVAPASWRARAGAQGTVDDLLTPYLGRTVIRDVFRQRPKSDQ